MIPLRVFSAHSAAAFAVRNPFFNSANLFMQAALDLPGTAAATFSHLMETSLGNAFKAFSNAISSAELQPLSTTFSPSSAFSSTTLLSNAFLFFKNNAYDSESSTLFSPNSFAFFITLSTPCLPPNAAAIASHLPGFPTGFFTICFFSTSTSSSLHPFSSSTTVARFSIPEDSFLFSAALTETTGPTAAEASSALRCLDRRCEDFLLASSSGSGSGSGKLTTSPRPTRTSPPVMEGGAKGPTRRESASQKRSDLKGSASRKKRERVRKSEERETVAKRNGLVGLWIGCGGSLLLAAAPDWNTNLGLASSSRNSILSQTLETETRTNIKGQIPNLIETVTNLR
ncbi:hypothetical protein GmHk_05G014155 [Glycine max]|nr:hypothetical protein GmHk_05G014155 [Glycine max]